MSTNGPTIPMLIAHHSGAGRAKPDRQMGPIIRSSNPKTANRAIALPRITGRGCCSTGSNTTMVANQASNRRGGKNHSAGLRSSRIQAVSSLSEAPAMAGNQAAARAIWASAITPITRQGRPRRIDHPCDCPWLQANQPIASPWAAIPNRQK